MKSSFLTGAVVFLATQLASVVTAEHAHAAEPALSSTGAVAAPIRLSIADMNRRVAEFHPQLRARAAEQLRSEVALRRANWDRLRVGTGVLAGYGATGNGLAGTADSVRPPGSAWSDGAAAQVFADVRLPLYAGGAISGAIEAAEARVDVSKSALTLTEQELKRIALVAYATAVAADRNVEVARAARDRALSLVQLAQTRQTTGVGSVADVARSRLNELRRDEELVTREGDVAITRATLRAVLVLEENAPIVLVDSLETVSAYVAGSEAGRYPELEADRARVRAAGKDASVARAGYIPNLELFASGAYGSGAFTGTYGGLGTAPYVAPLSDRFQPFRGDAMAGAMITWRGFDMFVVRDRIATADRTEDVARAQLSETERAVTGRRAEARAREERARKRVEVLRSGDVIATEAVRLARVRYETGNTILTEVLDAELDSISVQARIVDAAYELSVAHIERLRAEGLYL